MGALELLKEEIRSEMLCHRPRTDSKAGQKISAEEAEYIADKLAKRMLPLQGDLQRERKFLELLSGTPPTEREARHAEHVRSCQLCVGGKPCNLRGLLELLARTGEH